MAEELRTLNADLLAIRGALEADGPAGTPAAALQGKLAQEFLAAVHGFHARFAQCRRMQAVAPGELETRLQEVSGDPGCWFYIGCTRALTHYLWEAGPWGRAWQHRAAGYEKTCTYYCRPGPGAGLCTVRHLLGRFCGTHPRCLNASRVRNGPVGIVFLVTYARRGSRPGEPAEDMEVALRGIAAHFHHRGAPADELVQFLKDDFRQLMGRYPGSLAQCQAMSQIPPAHFPERAREILAGLGPAEGVLAGTVPGGVVSMRPCLWEVGAGEAQAGEKLHTYFTRLDGALDAKRLLGGQVGDSAGGLPVPGAIPGGLRPGRALSEGADLVPLPSPERVWLGRPDPRPSPVPAANRERGPWRSRAALCHARDERETEAACSFPPPTAGTSATEAATPCSHWALQAPGRSAPWPAPWWLSRCPGPGRALETEPGG